MIDVIDVIDEIDGWTDRHIDGQTDILPYYITMLSYFWNG